MKIACVPLLAVFLFGCQGKLMKSESRGDFNAPLDNCANNAALQKAQLEAQIAANNAQAAFQARVQEVQFAVVKACVDSGRIPIFINGGNVDCKAK